MFPYHVAVTNIEVVDSRLIVLSDHEVKSLPLSRCNAVQLQSCASCVALSDPYCAWNLETNTCVDHSYSNENDKVSDVSALVQSVYSGKHAACTSSSEYLGTLRISLIAVNKLVKQYFHVFFKVTPNLFSSFEN